MDRNWIPPTETGPRVTDEDVRHFERSIGHELPPDYRAFLLDVNGGYAPRSHRVLRLRKDTYPLNNFPKDGIAIGYDGTGSRIVLLLAGRIAARSGSSIR